MILWFPLLNNPINPSFESDELEIINIATNIHINIF